MASARGRLRLAILVVVPLLIAAAVGLGAWRVWESYGDVTQRWTAVGAIAAAGAFVAAIVGIPAALSQLSLVERDLSRLARVRGDEQRLLVQMHAGMSLATRLQDAALGTPL